MASASTASTASASSAGASAASAASSSTSGTASTDALNGGGGGGGSAGHPTFTAGSATAASRRPGGPWLHAWSDPVASLKAYSPCVRLADLYADGEYCLLVADADKKLKVFKNTALVTEQTILDVPCALAIFYSDLNKPQTPSVAVAAGSYIYIYRNLRPYYKFTLPPVDLEQSEIDLWTSYRNGNVDLPGLLTQLSEAKDNGVPLSSRSITLLNVEDKKDQEMYADTQKLLPLVQLTVATCMETLNKNLVNERAVSSLVIGTESGHVLIMDPSGTSVLKKLQLPSVPVMLAVSGTYDVDYRIVVACRNGNLYTIKKGKVTGMVIELETQPCGLTLLDKSILVGCMDNVLHSFNVKGKKNYSIYLPESILAMDLLLLRRVRNASALLLALNNGEVRMYNQKHMIASFTLTGVITALRYGPYGREEASLVLISRNGALTIKMLQRQANLDVTTDQSGPPPEQDIPLNIPKKTKLYVEQTGREREQGIDMHRVFQKDLCKLRLNTARSYVKVLMDGSGPISSIGGTQLRLEARVQGLGPIFKLRLKVKNTGAKMINDIPITMVWNHEFYKVRAPLTKIPCLVPGIEYQCEADVESIHPTGAADPIRVFLCNPKSAIPAISAIVNMPISEPPLE